MFKNNPNFIIVHFTNVTSKSDLEITHQRQYNQPIPTFTSQYYSELYPKVTYIQSHHYIDSQGITYGCVPEDLPVFHHFSNNAIHIHVYDKYNFMQPSDVVLNSLYLKIFELQQKYNISFFNIMSDFQTRIYLDQIRYSVWTANKTYYRGDIIKAPDNIFYEILNPTFESDFTDFTLGKFNNTFSDIDIVTSKVTLIDVNFVGKIVPLTNDKIMLYDFTNSTINTTTESNFVSMIDGRNLTVDLTSLTSGISPIPLYSVTLNQKVSIGSQIPISLTGKYYLKVKPVSDFNIQQVFTNDYLQRR